MGSQLILRFHLTHSQPIVSDPLTRILKKTDFPYGPWHKLPSPWLNKECRAENSHVAPGS